MCACKYVLIRTCACAQNKVATHGHASSNAQEIINGVLAGARCQTPYWFNDYVLQWLGQKHDERVRRIHNEILKQHRLTPYARELWMIQARDTLSTFN